MSERQGIFIQEKENRLQRTEEKLKSVENEYQLLLNEKQLSARGSGTLNNNKKEENRLISIAKSAIFGVFLLSLVILIARAFQKKDKKNNHYSTQTK